MARNKLETVANGDIFTRSRVDSYRQALIREFVPRDETTGAVAPASNLGTSSYRFAQVHAENIIINGSSIDETLFSNTNNAVVSGRVRTATSQPTYVRPAGAGNGASLTLLAATTPLSFRVAGVLYSCTKDITESSLTTAPTSNHTATLSESGLQNEAIVSRTWGEDGIEKEYLTVTSMGSEITALVGKFAAFKIVNSSTSQTEYFFGFVESSTKISRCRRGFFYDHTDAPIKRIKLRNSVTITLMSLAWVFLGSDGEDVFVTYKNPTFGGTAPSSPATNDYWLDSTVDKWKRYSGSAFVEVDRTLVGMAVIDGSDCVAARSLSFFREYSDRQSLAVGKYSNSLLLSAPGFSGASVDGNGFDFNSTFVPFTSSDIAAAADTYGDEFTDEAWWWYVYLTENGAPKISNMEPYFYKSRGGYYHPFQEWRCIGRFIPDGSNFPALPQAFPDDIARFNPYARKQTYSGSSTIISPVSTYVAIPLDTEAGLWQQFMAWDSSTVFRFLNRGRHEIAFDFAGIATVVAESKLVQTVELKIVNNTLTSDLIVLGRYDITRENTNAERHPTSFKRFVMIEDCTHTFTIKAAIVALGGGTAETGIRLSYLTCNWLGKR